MKKIILPVFMIIALLGAASCSEKSADPIMVMSGEKLDSIAANAKEKDNYLIIDVREDYEYKESHLENSINISVNELEKRINEISSFKEKNIVVLCRSGRRSRMAAQILVNNGFKKVFDAPGVTKYKYKNIVKPKK
ncbi:MULTISPECIES: rhodanese-like domain-containing protein [unclassified Treponema]|uniref:rhodanese-like domain-containing protein n=1 Tax=unclassified Treponema TaxID=2638727 RepID=UPI0020A28F69|nr:MULTISPECIES: rhodanese-like domain-containing protein [unclassified Treponema]UTC66361.1 rhodanese-like domain-containing protein [Treponema sp. OMZ 789]UTC69091.1 rhodanese-like domain-containing protein [Treponema sp. OMZ 790]UTC71803.1 rhodanese-like domain-containing protein [Treponema sp. OMZ 791]